MSGRGDALRSAKPNDCSALLGVHESRQIELGDAFIAATAAVHNLELWTRKPRHYPMKDIAFYPA